MGRALSIRARLYLLVALPLAGIVLYVAAGWMERARSVSEMEAITQQVSLASEGGELVHYLQRERGRTAGWLAGEGEATDPGLQTAREASDEAARRLHQRLDEWSDAPEGPFSGDDPAIRPLLDSLTVIRDAVDRRHLEVDALVGFFNRLNDGILRTVVRTTLAFDHPDVIRQASVYASVLELKEAAGVERALVNAALTRGRFRAQESEDLLVATARQQFVEESLIATPYPALLSRIEAEHDHPGTQRAFEIREQVMAEGPGAVAASPEEWFDVKTDRIDRLRELELEALGTLEEVATDLVREARTQQALFGSLGALFLLVTVSAAGASARSIGRPLERLARGLREVSESPPPSEVRLSAEGPRELVTIAREFNAYAERMGALIHRAEVSEARFRQLFERVPVGLYRSTPDGRLLEANPALAEMLGYDQPAELEGRSMDELYMDPRDRARWLDDMSRHGVVRNMRTRLQRSDGEVIWVSDSARVVKGAPNCLPDSGEACLVCYEGSLVDITAWHQAEQELRKLSTVVAQTADAVMITDPRGRIQYANPSYEAMSGYSREELLGRTPAVVQSGQQGEAFYRRLWTTITAGQPFQATFANVRKNGERFYVLQTITPLETADGEITHFVATGKEITEELRIEERLRQVQRLEAMGEMAAGVAHDFNNLLTVISNNLYLALEDIPKEFEDLRESLSQALEAGHRGASLTQNLLAYTGRQPEVPRSVNLAEAVVKFQGLVRRVLPASIQIKEDVKDDPLWIRMDPAQLDQILLNMAVNARDAMPEGGTFTLKASRAAISERDVVNDSALYCPGPGVWALLEVEDTGVGMDDRTRQRAFEPFFTTKTLGEGTGLGLATVYGIVDKAGGVVEVRTAPGEGTRFQLYLPESAPAGGSEDDPGAEGEGATHSSACGSR